MKDKQKSLEDIDFLTELTPGEQERITGGAGAFTSPPRVVPNGDSTPPSQADETESMWDIHKLENPTDIISLF
ncbi:MAG: hypothetical protein SAK29_13015 [Scytonema sp. PMC 1069.18]|nr:hypothetical protein [Scytonema sp. PMC 1069.18]MEC4882303.1 hypothetical protein [Scytonema sp. PMC 1070.18]